MHFLNFSKKITVKELIRLDKSNKADASSAFLLRASDLPQQFGGGFWRSFMNAIFYTRRQAVAIGRLKSNQSV
jgi:hypothetical protein